MTSLALEIMAAFGTLRLQVCAPGWVPRRRLCCRHVCSAYSRQRQRPPLPYARAGMLLPRRSESGEQPPQTPACDATPCVSPGGSITFTNGRAADFLGLLIICYVARWQQLYHGFAFLAGVLNPPSGLSPIHDGPRILERPCLALGRTSNRQPVPIVGYGSPRESKPVGLLNSQRRRPTKRALVPGRPMNDTSAVRH